MDPGLIAALDRAAEHRDLPLATGGTMRWRRFGAGPPLVLIHGGHGSWLHWVANIEALAAHHTLWVADVPGYGDSTTLPPEAGFEDIAAAVASSLDALIGPGIAADIAAFSFGGAVAGKVAVTRGARRLVLLGTAGHGTARRQGMDMRSWRNLPPESRPEAFRHNLAALMIHDAGKIDALAMAAYEASCAATHFVSRPISRGVRLAPLLEPFAGPALFLWGEHDVTCTPADAARVLCGAHPLRKPGILPGAGHWVQYEAAAEVNRRLLDAFRGSE